MPEPANPDARRASLLGRLMGPDGSGLESGDGGSLEGATARIDPKAWLDASERRLRDRVQSAGHGVDPEDVKRLISDAGDALQLIRAEGPNAVLSSAMESGLEAVIETSGARPVLFIQNDRICPNDPDLLSEPGKTWRGRASMYQDQIAALAPSVGAVVTPQSIVGTAFMVGDGLVLTNRHVVEHPYCAQHLAWNGSSGTFDGSVRVEFVGEKDSTRSIAFDADTLVLAGPDPIWNWPLDFEKLDIALIRLKPSAGMPRALPLSSAPLGPLSREVHVIGFPMKPRLAVGNGNAEGDTGAPAVGHEYAEILDKLFEGEYGVKRWAPGEIRELPGVPEGDNAKWVLSHDASTLGGNSGSLIADFSDGGDVALGIHFAGCQPMSSRLS